MSQLNNIPSNDESRGRLDAYIGSRRKYFQGPSVCLEDGTDQEDFQGSQPCLSSTAQSWSQDTKFWIDHQVNSEFFQDQKIELQVTFHLHILKNTAHQQASYVCLNHTPYHSAYIWHSGLILQVQDLHFNFKVFPFSISIPITNKNTPFYERKSYCFT